MPPRSEDWWFDDWPLDVGSPGALHDLSDQTPAPRLYGLKSVSKHAVFALDRRRDLYRPRRAGFIQ